MCKVALNGTPQGWYFQAPEIYYAFGIVVDLVPEYISTVSYALNIVHQSKLFDSNEHWPK